MADDWQTYVKDPRTVCKYGSSCYQKNPEHHQNFKHPPLDKHKKFNNKRGKPYHKPQPKDKVKHFEKQPKDSETEKTKNQTVNEDFASSSSTIVPVNDVTEIDLKLPDKILYHEPDVKKIQELFLVEMPSDFYKFYECLKDESDFEKILSSVNLELIGPFDLLLGKLPILDQKDLYLIHWRYFYDPPEFQAILKKKGKSEFHMGYFRDSPEAMPVFVASNDSAKDYQITPMAENIFGAVYLYLQNEKKTSPFVSVACQKLMDKVKNWAEAHQFSIEPFNMKTRLAQMVTKSFHGAGIVVPFDKKTKLGYRKLVENNATIKKLFERLESSATQSEKDKILSLMQPVITYASIAVDECDFGTGLEIGIALFCSGLKELQASALSSLCSVYSLVQRNAFSKVIQVHMKYRRKGSNMSILSANVK